MRRCLYSGVIYALSHTYHAQMRNKSEVLALFASAPAESTLLAEHIVPWNDAVLFDSVAASSIVLVGSFNRRVSSGRSQMDDAKARACYPRPQSSDQVYSVSQGV